MNSSWEVMEKGYVVSVGEAVKDMTYRTPQELVEKMIINFTELMSLFQKIFNQVMQEVRLNGFIRRSR